MNNSADVNDAMHIAATKASEMHHEYVTPEHLLYGLSMQDPFLAGVNEIGVGIDEVPKKLEQWLYSLEPMGKALTLPIPSAQFTEVLKNAVQLAVKRDAEIVNVKEYIEAILMLEDSMAAYILISTASGNVYKMLDAIEENSIGDVYSESYDDSEQEDISQQGADKWKTLVSDISKEAETHTPLIGREKEMDRTIQILCRMEKNNPMHVGDPGVGKTAIIYGLASLINANKVPDRLKQRKIYGMNMGSLLAGTQYRGDFEKRLKMVLDGAMEENAILYLDEIHNIIGAGSSGDGGPDASNILKPYLESGKLSFIGATTHEEYNRKIAKDRAIVRRFQTIDIQEPSVEETVDIVLGLQPAIQKFHNVTFRRDVIEYAVRASARLIPDRRLPDKAIDLVDEAGAYLEVHPVSGRSRSWVTRGLIDEILKNVCKVQAEALKSHDNEELMKLKDSIMDKIYGQDKAVEELTDAVMMAKAGLTDDNKPLASLLFVGPTGVGKTEVARVLAQQLGVELVRFDMSEYTEKHAVAKLIGSPAGYVGYEDGGLLTAAIKKTPNCVLLLDEIEKSHSDIYNILLQVMDYAKLTDNRGQKADFRNVILIMTSNAGAQYASQASIGFGGGVSRGDAMMKQVKKTFKPEFINRLSNIVVFNDMDENMARMILNKKLGELQQKLNEKKVTMHTSEEAFNRILQLGFTKEYGAREMDRVIAHEIKPLFMREILFGKLKKGGDSTIVFNNGTFCLNCG